MADRSLRTDSAKSERLYKQIIDTPVHDNDVIFTLLLRQCTANLNLKHFAKAKEIVDTASRQFPRLAASSSKLHCLRGGACLGLENYSQAFYETEMAIQLAPENYQAQFWHATSLFYLNEFAKSLQSLEIVIRNVKKHIASRMLAIECKRKCGLWKDIINDSLRMLNFQSLNGNIKSSIHCALAEGFMHVGELKKAECAASTAIAHNKSNRLAFQIRGEARYNLNQFKSSCADFHSFQTLSIEKRGGGKINSAAFTKWRTGGKQQRDQIHHGIHDTHFKLVVLPIQLHAIPLSLFASVVAPFGGFFASGIKRAYGIKDFDSIIPGHGGVMDRMDCQFLRSLCTWVHYNAFIQMIGVSVPKLLFLFKALPQSAQEEFLRKVKEI
ncbi:hypothetical protein ScalyP_jg9694 [Parmales sp. scaly parma]|nr:hypothetical protein ScalyP_jg9694 [Parmales sp. scaly parma]